MPLIKSKKESAVRQNTQELIASGRDPKQAYAIAGMFNVGLCVSLLHRLRSR